jgi:hypothetical protein
VSLDWCTAVLHGMLRILIRILVQALEEALAAYRVRHEQCTSGSDFPGKYVVTLMADDYAGLGNQLPSIITGAARMHACMDACAHPSVSVCCTRMSDLSCAVQASCWRC